MAAIGTGYGDGMAGFSGDDRDDDASPDPEVFIVDDAEDEAAQREPARRRPPLGNGRRAAIALGVVVAFAVGVILGRSSLGSNDAQTAPITSPTSRASSMTASAQTTATSSAQPSKSRTESAITGQGRQPTGDGSSAAPGESEPLGTPVTPSYKLVFPNSAFSSAITDFFPGGSDIQSIAIVGDQLVALARGYLVRIGRDDGRLSANGTSRVGLPIGDPSYARWQLVSDGSHLWVAALGPGLRLYPVDWFTLTLAPLVRLPPDIADVAALGGHLYVNTNTGVFGVAPFAHNISQPAVARGGPAMAADPTRRRLLVLEHDNGGAIFADPPTGHGSGSAHSLPFDAQSVAVADGQIWVTGMTNGAGSKPVLARLDPDSLAVRGHSAVETRVTGKPVIVAHGTHLWVRGSDSGNELWCVDAENGAIDQHWSDLPGQIAARDGRAYVADHGTIGQLTLNKNCAG